MKRGCGCLAAVPVMIFGLVFTLVGAGLLISAINKRADFVSTSGIIIDLVGSSDPDGSTTYAPVIEFEGPDGELYRFTSDLSRNPAPDLGDTVGVLYNPKDPTDATEDSVWLLFVFPIIALVVGFLVDGVGVFLLVRGLRSSNGAELRSKTRRAVVIGASTPTDQPPTAAGADPPSPLAATAQFRRVEPRGPDAEGRFEYRVVARDADGGRHYSEWLSDDPTTALLAAGADDLDVVWREGQSVVVNLPL